MALLERGITPSMVTALSVDIADNPQFHHDQWDEMSTVPNLHEYIESRIRQISAIDPDPARLCLAILSELHALSKQQDFSDEMGLATRTNQGYRHLGSLPIEQQIEQLEDRGLPV